MNTFLINYLKREGWLRNRANYIKYLTGIRAYMDEGLSERKATKKVRLALYRIIRKYT